MGGKSSTEISNEVIANTSVALAQHSQIDSIIIDKSDENILLVGDNNVVENIHMDISMTVTDYVAGDANMDADLVSSLTSKFTASIATQQVALLGALNKSADDVKNLVKNSIAAGLSASTLQRCLAKMGTKESITVIGNNNVIRGVTMNTMQTLYHECVQSTSAEVHTAAQTQSWADGAAKQTQTGPLDGLFSALDNLTAGIGMMPLVLAGGGILVLLIVIFLVFSGGGGSAPIVVKGSGELAPRVISGIQSFGAPIVGGLASFISGGEADAESLADCGIEVPESPSGSKIAKPARRNDGAAKSEEDKGEDDEGEDDEGENDEGDGDAANSEDAEDPGDSEDAEDPGDSEDSEGDNNENNDHNGEEFVPGKDVPTN